MSRRSGRAAAVTMVGIAGLHVAWGLGSSYPFATRDELADKVIGSGRVPPPAACHAVASALLVAAGLAADVPVGSPLLRRIGRVGVATVLGARGTLGLVGRTDLVSPGSSSPAFRRMDRRVYAPLCLALAAATVSADGEPDAQSA